MGSWVEVMILKPIHSEFQRPLPTRHCLACAGAALHFLAGTVYGTKRENQTGGRETF